MTREEAIVQIKGLKKYCEDMADSDESGSYVFDLDVQALDIALTALSTPTREMVEKMRGEWRLIPNGVGGKQYMCSKCGGAEYEYWRRHCPRNGCTMGRNM